MQHDKPPTPQEVRDWLKDLLASHKPPPAPEVIRDQLWHHAERDRKARLS